MVWCMDGHTVINITPTTITTRARNSFLEMLTQFFGNFTRGHDITHLIFSEFKFYRLDLLWLWGQFNRFLPYNCMVDRGRLSISSILESFIIFILFYEKPWSSHMQKHTHIRDARVCWKSRTMQILKTGDSSWYEYMYEKIHSIFRLMLLKLCQKLNLNVTINQWPCKKFHIFWNFHTVLITRKKYSRREKIWLSETNGKNI